MSRRSYRKREKKSDDADDSDMDLSDDSSQGDDDAVGFGVFMHNKSTTTPNSTYLSPTVTNSSLNFIQNLLNETPTNEFDGFCAFKVPLGTHVDVQASNVLLQEMFLDDNAHHIPSLPAKKIPYTATSPQPSSLQAKAKKLMQKTKKNMRKINFKKAVAQKFREYDQKLEALTNFNVSEAFEKDVQEKVLTVIKKLLPSHIPKAVANYVRPRINTYVLKVMKNNQINLFTQSSTSTDNLLEMDLKLKLLNRIHLNKSNETHTTHQQLYDTLYDSITLDQQALDAQNAEPSFHKRSHDNQDTPNDHIDQNKNNILGPYTVAIAKKLKAIIQKDELTIADLEGAGLERLKQQYQNDVELEYHVNQLKATVLTEAKWNNNEDKVSKPITFERHMSKNTKPHHYFYNNDFYYLVCLSTEEKYTTSITKYYVARYYKQGIEDMISDRWCKETHLYIFEALNGIHHWKDSRINFFKAEMSTRTEGNVYSDLRIKLVVRIVVKKKWGYGFLTSIVVRRSDDKEYEFSCADLPRLSLNDVEDMYLLQVQDKLHHLPLEFVKDFNNALFLFIRRVVI
ncbi:hypothetical protein Tco_0097989 [Tanacetum coccineum]